MRAEIEHRLGETGLPVVDVLPELHRALEAGAAVLEAPPGAGKSTLVPLALLDEAWLGGNRIIVLEPRRLAARAAAARMASLLGESVGHTVGYRVRFDTNVGPETRIEVVTEGVLTRMLQDDPLLNGVGLIIFDEYHERNLQADLGLALALDIRDSLRHELRLLMMSATMDARRMASFLDAPLVRSEGRVFDVDVTHDPGAPGERLVEHVVRTTIDALNAIGGDVLVFLAGEGEIRMVQRRLSEAVLAAHIDIMPLFGSLPAEEQDRAIRPSEPGRRKIVLATNIAETSLTIEGVTAVIDSGQVRRPRFDTGTGMTVLETVRVSRSSADQRAGRAGRLAPGMCFRLWSRLEDEHLREHDPPEITVADLTPLALELALWGVRDAEALRWLDAPPAARMEEAYALLQDLDVIDPRRMPTAHGRRVSRHPIHPRLAHMLVSARDDRERRVAAAIAGVLSERDLLRSDGETEPDLRLRLDLLAGRSDVGRADVRRGALHQARTLARRLAHGAPLERDDVRHVDVGRLLAAAYPERLARKEGEGSYRLRSGEVVTVPPGSLVARSDYIVAAHIGGFATNRRLYLGSSISEGAVREAFAMHIERIELLSWDDASGSVMAEEREMLGALILGRRTIRDADPERVTDVLMEFVVNSELRALPWTKESEHLRQRLQFMHAHDATWPDFSDEALIDDIQTWLRPFLSGMRRVTDLRRLDLQQIFLSRAGWGRVADLDRAAPSHLEVPSGSRIRIDYSDPHAPVLAVRIQEMFGATETPRVAGGRVPLTLHLLSPAHRPAQITQDLEGFWTDAYFDVRRDLRGRYPKHAWPEDPLSAAPTRRVARR